MSANVLFRRKRPAGAGRTALTALALFLASLVQPALAQAGAQPDTSVFTIIVTRHGVRAISPPTRYAWPDWEVGVNNLTGHGYRLMKLMGELYRKEGIPVDCSGKTEFIYADTDQRTLATAHALIEGLCGSPDAFFVFHGRDDRAKDPIFDATDRLSQLGRINGSASTAAAAAVAGSPSSSLVMRHAGDFATFQTLLDTRCPGNGCEPLVSAASLIEGGKKLDAAQEAGAADAANQAKGKIRLAELKGPLGTSRSAGRKER